MFKSITFGGKLFSGYLKLFSHPAKIRIQNIAGNLFLAKGINVRNEADVLLSLEPNDWISRIILKEGNYESASTSLATKLLSKGGLFIDIGANFGLFTCIAAKSNPGVTVIAVEPNFKVIPRLLTNIRLNNFNGNVRVLNTAVSNKFQWVTMEQPALNNLGTTVTKAGVNGLINILSCPLEYICEQNDVHIIELLKIDIEGNEFAILEKFPFDKYLIKNIILEFNHLSKISFGEMKTFFSEKGFDVSDVYGNKLENAIRDIPEHNIWFRKKDV